jgi:hypothetical protein
LTKWPKYGIFAVQFGVEETPELPAGVYVFLLEKPKFRVFVLTHGAMFSILPAKL